MTQKLTKMGLSSIQKCKKWHLLTFFGQKVPKNGTIRLFFGKFSTFCGTFQLFFDLGKKKKNYIDKYHFLKKNMEVFHKMALINF